MNKKSFFFPFWMSNKGEQVSKMEGEEELIY